TSVISTAFSSNPDAISSELSTSTSYSLSIASDQTFLISSSTLASSSTEIASSINTTTMQSFPPSVDVSSTSTTGNITGIQIVIHDVSFNPGVVKVVIGVNNTVTWMNEDPFTHTVTSDSGLFDSGYLYAGSNFTFIFETPGNYSYHCAFHTIMMGTIIVLSANQTSGMLPSWSTNLQRFDGNG